MAAMAGTKARGRGPSPLATLFVLLLVAAVAAGGWTIWTYWGTVQQARPAATKTVDELRSRWRAEPAPTPSPGATPSPRPVADPQPGRAEWILRIPKLGNTEWPVAAGTDAAQLSQGIGWYPGTSQPGQLGNFAVTALRITQAEAFRRLLDLNVGDEVVVESRDAIFTYRLTTAPRDLTVAATDDWVLDPVPGKTDVEPYQALITLTTSEDFVPTPDRLVAFGVLDSTELK